MKKKVFALNYVFYVLFFASESGILLNMKTT